SEIKFQEGDLIGPGVVIGLSGDTGRVSGPHLHWGLRMQGLFTDGLSLEKAGI
ncbi:MAG: M23 family metallopeptidase, partial [Bacteriovoracaceae bacterium]|nr:M23 family metallopeptidase [Bacteriovoracaceae bacterium]